MKRRALLRAGAASLMGLAAAPLIGKPSTAADWSDCCPAEGEIRLCCNENPYGPSPLARQAIQDSLVRGNRYPQAALKSLKQAIADANGLSPEQVFVAPGSVSILRLAAWWLARQQKAVLSSEHTFQWLLRFARQLGSDVITVPATDSMHFDLSAIKNRLDKDVGLVYLCNPNNPTSTSLPLTEIQQFCRTVAPDYPVFLDEAYVEYLPDFKTHNAAVLLADYSQLMISRTFSKIYGMAGMRIGYLLAAPEIVTEMESLDIGFNISVSNVSAEAALASLSDTTFLSESLAQNEKSRSILLEQLSSWNIPHFGSTANFVYADVSRYGVDDMKAAFAEKEIVLNPHTIKDKNYLRISLGRPSEMEALGQRLNQFFTKHK
ncbi:MAG: histidinol-phosphate transaminase [Bacteroidota bacterium]